MMEEMCETGERKKTRTRWLQTERRKESEGRGGGGEEVKER